MSLDRRSLRRECSEALAAAALSLSTREAGSSAAFAGNRGRAGRSNQRESDGLAERRRRELHPESRSSAESHLDHRSPRQWNEQNALGLLRAFPRLPRQRVLLVPLPW